MNYQTLARGLGGAGILLGLAEFVAPKRFGALVGMEPRAMLLRVYGLREIASGVAVLVQRNPAPSLWARVGGDAVDLVTLGAGLARSNRPKRRLGVAFGAVAAIGALDAVAANKLGAGDGAAAENGTSSPAPHEHDAKRVVAVAAPADALYRLWRDPKTLPLIMGDAAEVTHLDASRARWKVDAPLGRTLVWETEIVEDRPGELLRWRSLPGDSLPTDGSVAFRPSPTDRGTHVSLQLRFSPPPGPLGAASALLPAAVPASAVGVALRRFKSLAEIGRVVTADPRPQPTNTAP